LLRAVLYLKFAKFSKPLVGKTRIDRKCKGIMDASYFYLFILPLGIIVAVLIALVYYYANKEEIAKRKTRKLVQDYIKERVQQQKAMNKELAKIDKLFGDKSIDKETCERLKNVLIVMNEKESKETMGLLKYVKNNR
jgi:hypothetical protein